MPFNVIEDATLFARQFLGFVEPADYDVSVEQKSRIQLLRFLIAPQRIPQM
jgi:hypothetical protein